MKFTGSKAWVALLVGAVAAGALFTQCTKQEAGKTVLGSAAEADCRTIVVGRESFGRFREFLEGHVSDEIVRRARSRTVWVVE